MSIHFAPTVHGTIHATAVVDAGQSIRTVRSIAAQARSHGATGPALRKVVTSPDETGAVIVHVAYRSA